MNHYYNTITVTGDDAGMRGLERLVKSTGDRNFKFLRENSERNNDEDTLKWSFTTPITDGSYIASDISAVYPSLNVHIKYQDPNMGTDGYMIFEDGECIQQEERDMYDESDDESDDESE